MSDLPPPPAYPPPLGPPPAGPPATFLVSSAPTPPRPARGPVIALAVIGVAIVACLAVAVPMLLVEDPTPADLSAVRAYDDLPVEHTADDVDYPQSPPVGGRHDPTWLDCGVYDEPVREENAVHDLEHGTVWISYDPDLDAGDVATLAERLPQNGLLAPYPGLAAPVVVTVWGRQLELEGADDPRLELFVRRYGGGETAPEPFASCAGGVRAPDGGGSGSGADV
ncbi:DUF3105 domain-containing protein [Nocardioides soli]|uniref:DUF3105 domain-containing protein n=1 Tax=Nocardioides soli TaxID=1036020 RepID=A0A7W4W0S7_9ACTN|nr:DUF3105 domain-containing protein [Nocardioides soli]MBB3044849.1 hypothetical protein [Nocardioides soli]